MGALLDICVQDPQRSSLDLRTFVHWLKPAVLHSQFLLLQDEGEVVPSGYVTWAWVDDATALRYQNAPRFVLHPSEWHEGLHLVVMDFCVLGDPTRFMRRLLRCTRHLARRGAASINVCIRDACGLPIRCHSIHPQHD
ncbi:toxin-activating lysine-acyltransferase [Chitiniphilus shinanonensis]|uniref:toxin-activating lysine-acyltransferase n=1 Tax=Chitiniphilus shinanonensis TaxID=553088 RepID=UPI0012FCAC9E|nr:toxin-activating lysine-acyltransferase [Chitiniphilus shinanonensis]